MSDAIVQTRESFLRVGAGTENADASLQQDKALPIIL